jgi:acyl carrier protein
MTDAEILEKMTVLLRDIFETPDLDVTPETNAKMVTGWDSMAQVKVLMAIEEEFGLRFSSREMDKLRNVGDLVAAVARHNGNSS